MTAWLEGARQLSEEGRLAWLLGQGLTQALNTVSGQRAAAPDPAAVLAQLRGWTQSAPDNATAWQVTPSDAAARHGSNVQSKSKPVGRKKTKRTAPFSWRDASTRRLDDRAYPVVFIGSRPVRGSWCSLALGIDLQGNKHALGGREDAQSFALLEEIATRGLGAEDGLLVV